MNQALLDELSQITPEEQAVLAKDKGVDQSLYADTVPTHTQFTVDCKKLLDSGKLIHIRPHTRFVHFPPHTHNYVEMIYMCAGSTTHSINGNQVVLQQGELLFLSQAAVQEILPAGKTDVAVNFIILPAFFDQTLSILGTAQKPLENGAQQSNALREFLVGCLTSSKSTLPFLHFQVTKVLPVQNLVENLIWTLVHGAQNKRQINQITMGLLFLHLVQYADRIRHGASSNQQETTLLAVLQYVEEHYRDGSLQSLANQLQLELTCLCKRIKSLTGLTYTQLVQNKRLNQASYLLTTTKLPVFDVSLAVGYDNFSYFHRLFLKHFGLSPGKYRRKSPGPLL